MTAELVLLLAVYATFILGLFLDDRYGLVENFEVNVPYLSARIERNVATGVGFWQSSNAPDVRWEKP